MQIERHEREHGEESIKTIRVSCQVMYEQCFEKRQGNIFKEKKRSNIAVEKAVADKHQRNHQRETLSCP